MFLTITSVLINTYLVDKTILRITSDVEAIKTSDTDTAYRATQNSLRYFKEKELYISLTVNHEDLTSIEDSFAEMLGNLSVGEKSAAEVTKNRLLCSLMHLRRLSGINIDAII
jgi:hypothetical protein